MIKTKYFVFKWLLCFFAFFLYGCSDGPRDVLRKYLNEKNWKEKVKYVRYPEKVYKLMEEKEYYEIGGKIIVDENIKEKEKSLMVGEFISYRVVPDQDYIRSKEYVIGRTKDGYKIDWESSVGYNPMTWEQFRFHKPKSPVRFRVVAHIRPDYSNHKAHGEDYWQLYLSMGGRDVDYFTKGGSVRAFIKKNSKDGEELFKILSDLKPHALMLDLIYTPKFHDTPYGPRDESDTFGLVIDKYKYGWVED